MNTVLTFLLLLKLCVDKISQLDVLAMSDYNSKIEELKKALMHTSNLRQLGNTARKKYKTYGLDPSSRSVKYKPAKIIECTQNVVEIRKLINDWRKLEKAKKASLDRMEHERWALETQYSRLLGEEARSELHESFQLEPGFRFKANGDIKKPKQSEITRVVDYIKNWNSAKRNMKQDIMITDTPMECQVKSFTNTSNSDPILGVASENSKAYLGSHSTNKDINKTEGRPTKDSDTILGTVNVTKAIEETEKVLNEIYEGKEMKEFKAKHSGTKASNAYLRAMSKQNQYSGGPNAVTLHCEMNKALTTKDSENVTSGIKRESCHKRRGFKTNCPACEFKLSGRKGDFIEKKMEQLQKPLKKWQSVSLNPSVGMCYRFL